MDFKNYILKIPTPIAGLALGISSLGLCWESYTHFNGSMQIATAWIAGLLLILTAVKFFLHPKILLHELSHPVVGSVIPTFAMALMVISRSVGLFDHGLGNACWIVAVFLHISFLAVFIYHRTKQFKLEHMVPSWFVPPVGIIVAAVTHPGNSLDILAEYLLYFGLAAYALLLPLMLYRLTFRDNIADHSKPTIAIMAAPASLSLAGYLSVIKHPDILIVSLLAGIAFLMTVMIYVAFFKLLTLAFSPGYAAFTFPMVIGATALLKTANWMQLRRLFDQQTIEHVINIAIAERYVATFIVAYVTVRYLIFGFKSLYNRHSTALMAQKRVA